MPGSARPDRPERGAVKFFERGKINARVAHGVLAECAMARQGVVPPKEDQPRLRFRAEQAVQHRRDHERHADREQVLRVGEDSAQALDFDRVRLDDAIEKQRIRRDDDPELPAVLVLQRLSALLSARAPARTARASHSPPPAWRTAAWEAAIARPSREATPEDDLASLRGGDLIAAPDERIQHHLPGMRVVVFRCGNESQRMRRRAVRLDRPEDAVQDRGADVPCGCRDAGLAPT